MPCLLSVNVGMPREVDWQGRTIYTGMWKRPLNGPATVRRLNIDGDGQGDTGGHGGEFRAVLVYQRESYDYWRQFLEREDLEPGHFGENFTVSGMADDEVCIGDRYRIGTACFEVTQPRVTCYRVGVRLGRPDMPALLVAHHRPGFYLRVITEGRVQAGDDIVQTERGPEQLTVAEIDTLLYLPRRDTEALRRALRIPALSPGWRQSFADLLTAEENPGGPASTQSETPETGAGEGSAWPGFQTLRVDRVVQESSQVRSFYLTNPAGSTLPVSRPGQYLTLRLAGAADPPAVRSYSLSAASSSCYRISVKREDQGLASNYLHSAVEAGQLLEVAAPRGEFTLAGGDSPVILASTGIGVTPVLAMLYALADQHSRREIWWLHGARNPSQHALAAEARTLVNKLPNAVMHLYYSAANEGELAEADAHSGHLDPEAISLLSLPATATAYICGPETFMTQTLLSLQEVGLEDKQINTELFTAQGKLNPGVVGEKTVPPHQPAGPAGHGPPVTFARSGLTVAFNPEAAPTLLDLAEACDVPTRWSCRSGVCHNCTTSVLAGSVSYLQQPLAPPAAGHVLICCAKPDTELVLDL
jgi:ferredoxin-NADP reductase/MOSC domain-containing protein YiiM